MKDHNIRKLFEVARKEAAPEVPFNFSQSVVSAIRREAKQASSSASLLDQLGSLFPRLAMASVMIIGICVGAELYFSTSAKTTATDVTQVAEEWLYASN